MQVQTIADVLGGLEADLPPRAFDEPWRTAYEAVLHADGDKRGALLEALADRPDKDQIAGAILGAVPGVRLGFPSLEEIADELPPIEWLWPGWVPRSMITLLGAAPGAGKSYVALDLARRIIAGDGFPDGSAIPRPDAPVIWVDAEVVPQIILDRARRWEMSLARLFLMLPEDKLYIDLDQPADRDRLVEMAAHLAPELIVVDSLSSITTKGENSVEDVREVLSFLNALALDTRCGLLLVHHLRKRGVSPMLDVLTIEDFRGSIHIVAMARSVIGLSVVQVGPKPDRNGPRRLDVVKTNLDRYPQPIGVEFVSLHPTGARLQYGGAPERYEEPTKEKRCQAWLLQLLKKKGKPMRPKDIITLADDEGFSQSLVYDARRALEAEIVSTEGKQSPKNKWALAGWDEELGEET